MKTITPFSINWPKSGSYVLAISGGVDSVVLLDYFAKAAKEKNYKLLVAHFDHRMRQDSAQDAIFVQKMAQYYRIEFRMDAAVSNITNEAEARSQRYNFLQSVATDIKAENIITAHHLNDLIETSLLNLARGSGRTGLVPFSSEVPLRPFHNSSRAEILAYAKFNSLEWREDVSNTDISNPRNFIRHVLFKKVPAGWTTKYLGLVRDLRKVNFEITNLVTSGMKQSVSKKSISFAHSDFLSYSLEECAEVLMTGIKTIDPNIELEQRLIQELVIFGKTAKPGRKRPVRSNVVMKISRENIIITSE